MPNNEFQNQTREGGKPSNVVNVVGFKVSKPVIVIAVIVITLIVVTLLTK
jgi:hypothetical protein